MHASKCKKKMMNLRDAISFSSPESALLFGQRQELVFSEWVLYMPHHAFILEISGDEWSNFNLDDKGGKKREV